jgi:hypothetical protein
MSWSSLAISRGMLRRTLLPTRQPRRPLEFFMTTSSFITSFTREYTVTKEGTLRASSLHTKAFVPALVHAYNCTRNDATGLSPFYLMFGHYRPIDISFGLHNREGEVKTYREYITALRKRIEYAQKVASSDVQQGLNVQKARYDHAIR